MELPKKAKVITAIAMFYDLPDPKSFIEDVKYMLDDAGIFVVQFTDLYSMLTLTAFDHACSEHLLFYDIQYLRRLFSSLGMHIFSVEYNKVNGGSVRLYIEKITSASDRELDTMSYYYFLREQELLANPHMFEDFRKRIETQKFLLLEELNLMKSKGVRVSAIGASTKGNTLLQVYGIDNTLIDSIYEVNSDKFGLKTLGSNIPIVPEDKLSVPPSALVLLPWHFIDNILVSYNDYLDSGGIIICPLPELKLYYHKGGRQWILEKKL
jgi:NDP-4-keto-2,6-dideoxyhexose 3-C-methyltransferase